MENLKQDVQTKFAEMRNALHMREKLLLRQAEVIVQQTKQHQQQIGRGSISPISESREVKFLAELEDELLTAIRNFGRFQLENINLTLQDVYLKNEDYITPANDHETMYKCLQQSIKSPIKSNKLDIANFSDKEQEQPEAIVVDFSRNKSLIEHNTKHMNKSIISITLQEAKELIKKAKMRRETPIPPLNLEELADELESSIAEAVSSLGGHDPSHNTNYTNSLHEEKYTKSSKKSSTNRFKPKITINNCNGTINLRNISNLTINCAAEDSISAQIPFQTQPTDQTQSQQEAIQSEKEFTSNSSHNDLDDKQHHSKSSVSTITNTTQKSATVIEAIVSSTDNTPTPTTTASSSNYSSSSSSRSQSKKHKGNTAKKSQSSQSRTYPYDIIDYDEHDHMDSNAVTCDFYNRLLEEIKNSLRTKRTNENLQYNNNAYQGQENIEILEASGSGSASKPTNVTEHPKNELSSNCSTNTAIQSGAGRRLVLKNFENLRIVLEANSSDEENFHPVQIEQWLAEIISETDLEPMQNTEILEHSKIHNESN